MGLSVFKNGRQREQQQEKKKDTACKTSTSLIFAEYSSNVSALHSSFTTEFHKYNSLNELQYF